MDQASGECETLPCMSLPLPFVQHPFRCTIASMHKPPYAIGHLGCGIQTISRIDGSILWPEAKSTCRSRTLRFKSPRRDVIIVYSYS
jgi:hypothetical protein